VIVFINGERREIDAANIEQLVERLDLPAATLLIEHNGRALRRTEWNERSLTENDRVEMLRIAAGG
jgi:thiamine biosynthesis protein ThiS